MTMRLMGRLRPASTRSSSSKTSRRRDGPYGSALTDAVADVNEKHRKLMIAPTAATTSIWEKGRRYLAMVLSPIEAVAEGLLDLAARNGLKNTR